MKSIKEKPSEQAVYIWNIAGSMTNSLLSMIVLMIVTRTVDSVQADIFSIGWTISQLMATIGTYQIRNYQATDVKGTFKFRQYLIFRFLTLGIMLVSSAVYIAVRNYDAYKSAIVFIVCLFRAVDSLADVYEGWFQQKERLDLTGKALTGRVIAAAVTFTATLVLTENLMMACIILVITYTVSFFCFNVRYFISVPALHEKPEKKAGKGWIWKLAVAGFPLFLNGYLMMDITNAPKMAIDTAISEGVLTNGDQTVFTVLFMPASILTLAYIVFRPLLTKMALAWAQGKPEELLRILGRIFACLAGVAVLGLAAGAVLGVPVLSLIYALDLSGYRMHLLIIILGGCLYVFSAVLDNVLVVIRKQYVLVICYVVTWIYIKLAAEPFVRIGGVMGASVVYLTSMALLLVITFSIFLYCFNKEKKKIQS